MSLVLSLIPCVACLGSQANMVTIYDTAYAIISTKLL